VRTERHLWLVVVLFLGFMPLTNNLQAEETDEDRSISGNVGLAVKYDTNVDLSSERAIEDEKKGDYIAELTARLAYSSPWQLPFHMEGELSGIADQYFTYPEDNWYVGRGSLYLGYTFGANTVSVLDEARYFTEPEDRQFDYFRNSATLAFKRVLSGLWQARIGYENIANVYPEDNFFNYYVNGGFVELRNTWTPSWSTYYLYDFQYYLGSYNSSTNDPLSSPESGYRHTGEIGLEASFLDQNNLVAAYTFQYDNSTGSGLNQIGNFEGETESLDIDAEFNFIKHKGSLLYSHVFNDRFTLSLYNEFILKAFIEREPLLEEGYESERRDLLFLTSAWLDARLYQTLYAEARYIFRMNDSTVDYEDFQDHIVSLGVEYRF